MSRPKPRSRRRAAASPADNSDLAALHAELGARLDQLRAAIECKRRQGWTVVRNSGLSADGTPADPAP